MSEEKSLLLVSDAFHHLGSLFLGFRLVQLTLKVERLDRFGHLYGNYLWHLFLLFFSCLIIMFINRELSLLQFFCLKSFEELYRFNGIEHCRVFCFLGFLCWSGFFLKPNRFYNWHLADKHISFKLLLSPFRRILVVSNDFKVKYRRLLVIRVRKCSVSTFLQLLDILVLILPKRRKFRHLKAWNIIILLLLMLGSQLIHFVKLELHFWR